MVWMEYGSAGATLGPSGQMTETVMQLDVSARELFAVE